MADKLERKEHLRLEDLYTEMQTIKSLLREISLSLKAVRKFQLKAEE